MSSKRLVKAKLINLITEKLGSKGVVLIADLINQATTDEEVENIAKADVPQLLEDLVLENKIAEIEYVLPDMPYRTKSFFLPAGTKIKVRGG